MTDTLLPDVVLVLSLVFIVVFAAIVWFSATTTPDVTEPLDTLVDSTELPS